MKYISGKFIDNVFNFSMIIVDLTGLNKIVPINQYAGVLD